MILSHQYSSDDEALLRFNNFKCFLLLIDERNLAEAAAGGTATHGITKFADLSEQEFSSTYLGYKTLTVDDDGAAIASFGLNGDFLAPSLDNTTITSKNWAGLMTTSVNDQGGCGSCWAFSATEQIESDSIRAGYLNTTQKLSVEQVVQWWDA